MTEYTEVKRKLQNRAFWVKKRLKDKDIIMTDGETDVRLIDTECGLYYAASRDNIPVSYHNDTIYDEEVWTGFNYHIEQSYPVKETDLALCHILSYVAHIGHYCGDMEVIEL